MRYNPATDNGLRDTIFNFRLACRWRKYHYDDGFGTLTLHPLIFLRHGGSVAMRLILLTGGLVTVDIPYQIRDQQLHKELRGIKDLWSVP